MTEYNWKRFWCPREGNYFLTDGGYLNDPESEFSIFSNTNCIPFESIENIQCLVLLGEPGIGKSTAMESQKNLLNQRIKAKGGISKWIDLNSYKSEERLYNDLFKSPVFQSWLTGDHDLHLFLDSLDECLLRIDTVANMLAQELKEFLIDRLYLRLSCRTAEWPLGLEENLKSIFGKDNLKIYELLPLRRKDVVEAAEINGLDSSVFLKEIDKMDVVPLAIKPITLQFLINAYKADAQLPASQTALYLQGCSKLCTETNKSRIDTKRTGTYTAEQRLNIAGRIAAITIFTNKSVVWTGLDLGDVPSEYISMADIYGGQERTKGMFFDVNMDAIRETLDTGLFSSRGASRLGWAHKTYAEFLASWYLVEHKLGITKVNSLIVHPDDPEGKVVPQLHEVAAWLGTMMPDLFHELVQSEPYLLLRSDVATADLKDKQALVTNLLQAFDEEKLVDYQSIFFHYYKKLSFQDLGGQLRIYINDRTKGNYVRRTAITIALACELKDENLQEELVTIALDKSQQLDIKEMAAFAICSNGDEDYKKRLKPLVLGQSGDDPKDELKGCALTAIWPEYISAQELFKHLSRPKRNSPFGAYKNFIRNHLVNHLQPTDIKFALAWLIKQPPRREYRSTIDDVEGDIMLKAWDNLYLPGIPRLFAKESLILLKHHDVLIEDSKKLELIKSQIDIDDNKRRKLIKTIVSILDANDKRPVWLCSYNSPIVLPKDLLWMIKQLKASRSENNKRKWAHLIYLVFDIRNTEHSAAIYYAMQGDNILAEVFSHLFNPVKIDSPEVQEIRAYQQQLKKQKEFGKTKLLKPSPEERVKMALDKFESGDLEAWWLLNFELTLETTSTHYWDNLQPDLKKLPGWSVADSKTKERIIEAAKKYVVGSHFP